MPFRASYVSDVGIDATTYPHHAVDRVSAIYRTARRGNIATCRVELIWDSILSSLYLQAVKGKLPKSMAKYDQLVVDKGLAIQEVLQNTAGGGFGVGQKMINLFMKDLWGVGHIQMPHEALLHAPLDRIVLSKIANTPDSWNAWSKVVAAGPDAQEIKDYLAIQQVIRALHQRSPVSFPSVIQMEQFIWHRDDFRLF